MRSVRSFAAPCGADGPQIACGLPFGHVPAAVDQRNSGQRRRPVLAAVMVVPTTRWMIPTGCFGGTKLARNVGEGGPGVCGYEEGGSLAAGRARLGRSGGRTAGRLAHLLQHVHIGRDDVAVDVAVERVTDHHYGQQDEQNDQEDTGTREYPGFPACPLLHHSPRVPHAGPRPHIDTQPPV